MCGPCGRRRCPACSGCSTVGISGISSVPYSCCNTVNIPVAFVSGCGPGRFRVLGTGSVEGGGSVPVGARNLVGSGSTSVAGTRANGGEVACTEVMVGEG